LRISFEIFRDSTLSSGFRVLGDIPSTLEREEACVLGYIPPTLEREVTINNVNKVSVHQSPKSKTIFFS
jgi:hypothetical protein